jgi:hypothetical protein
MQLVLSLLLMASTAAAPQVLKVFPAEGSALAELGPVGAELDFTRGESADPASLRLYVDGEDVTARARVTMTRDWPPSFVSIAFTPPALTPGTHRAEVRFRTAAGQTVARAWSFSVR